MTSKKTDLSEIVGQVVKRTAELRDMLAKMTPEERAAFYEKHATPRMIDAINDYPWKNG